MEDVRSAAPDSTRILEHPLGIAVLALPGALAGGALAPAAAARWIGGRLPEEPVVFLGAFAGAALSLRLAHVLHRPLRRLLAVAAPAAKPGAPRAAAVRPAATLAPGTDPGAPGAPALHLVCAPDVARVARGIVALAGAFLARGESVLVMDAGCGAPLHDRLGGVPRLGLAECLAERVPVLGLVQTGRVRGLWLLARGGARLADDWSQLGRVLDDGCSRFARVILAVPHEIPPRFEQGLGLREVAGWWAAGSGARRFRRTAQDRLGIRLLPLELPARPRALPEAPNASPPPFRAAPAPAPPVPAGAVPAPAPPLPPEPVLVDCDLHVRERLRFLIWMKRVQAERRSESEAALAGR